METKYLYRYVEDVGRSLLDYPMVEVHCKSYKVLRETEKSYLINQFDRDDEYGNKWILKTTTTSRKRFAYDTKEAALKNYIARRAKQIKILKYQLDVAEQGFKQASKIWR